MKLPYLMWICAATAVAQTPLSLDEVLKSVEDNYPPLLATLAERDIAEGDILQALGRFDLVLGAGVDSDRFGYYPNQRATIGFDQPLATWGSSMYGGWRVGQGDFAAYDGRNATRSLGEWRGGVRLPLVRNREIDDRRGNLEKARIGRRIADLSVDQQRLVVRQMATRRYWDWAAAGQRLRIAHDVLRVAEERDAALREASQLGQIPAIEVTENQRQILQRLRDREVPGRIRITDPEVFLFEVRDPGITLRDLSESVMREIIGDRTVDEIITIGRQERNKRLT